MRVSLKAWHCRTLLVAPVLLLLFVVLGTAVALSPSLLISTSTGTIRKFFLTGSRNTINIFGIAGGLGLALDRSGNIYAVSGDAVRKFSPRGQDFGIFASGGLNEPFSLAFDSAGNLFVGNNAFNTIRKFSPTGQDLGDFGSPNGRCSPSAMIFELSGNLLVAGASNLICEFSPTGEDLGDFASTGLSDPHGMVFDTSGNLLVTNSDNLGEFPNTIHKFSPTGQDLGTFASTGLAFPAGLAVDRFGNVYVANEEQRVGHTDYSIRKFSPTGEDLGDFVVLTEQPRYVVITTP